MQSAFFIKHREAEKVVFFKAPDDLLLVISDAHVFDLTVHDVRGLYFVIRENEVADRDDADKFFILIGDVQIIDI